MKRKEIQLIIIIAVVWLVILGIVKVNQGNKQEKNSVQENTTVHEAEEFVETMEDGTKLNVSNKLTENKNVNGIEIKNIQLTNKEGKTLLLADMTNKNNFVVEEQIVDLIIYNKNGEKMGKFQAIISKMKPGETKQFNIGMQIDYANAYDFEIIMH